MSLINNIFLDSSYFVSRVIEYSLSLSNLKSSNRSLIEAYCSLLSPLSLNLSNISVVGALFYLIFHMNYYLLSYTLTIS